VAVPSPNGQLSPSGLPAAPLTQSETEVRLAELFAAEAEPELVYATEALPGIRRRRHGRGFSYHFPDGETVRDADVLARIRSLVIPPAWRDVWICPLANGHLQATGRDAKGRKQYRYHPRWRELRDATKFDRLVRFGQALPRIRERASADLRKRTLTKEKVLAAVVLLLDHTLIRVGNEEYARQNGAHGLTTLRDSHVHIQGDNLRFVFRGKGGKQHNVGVRNRRLARAVRQSQELPGEELFQYVSENGPRSITSGDVNEYLRVISSDDFTAKDFRTWGGTLVAARALAAAAHCRSKPHCARAVNRALDAAAHSLGNTRAVSRRSYVHPWVIDSYLDGSLVEEWPRLVKHAPPNGLRPEEWALIELLKERQP